MSRTPMEQFGDALKENRDLCEKVAALREALGAGLLLAQMQPGIDISGWIVMARKVLADTQ